jgi:CheY-like chemotaxis protein
LERGKGGNVPRDERPLILIADDDADVLETLAEQLADRYDVIVAADGMEAIQWLGQHRSAVCALLLDLHMPNMGGFHVLEYLQWARLPVPVILYTANAAMADLLRRQAMPIAGILVKPARRDDLIRHVEAALRMAA